MKKPTARKRATPKRAYGSESAYSNVNPPRVRQVVTRRPLRMVGVFRSIKANGYLHWESQLEKDFFRLLEVDSSVVFYAVQPEVLTYELNGKRREYTPDARVEYRCGRTEFVEVKYEDTAAKPKYQELFRIAKRAYEERDCGFRVMTEKDIRQEPLLENAKYLLDHRINRPSERFKSRVADVFNTKRPATLGELREAVGLPAGDLGDLLGLILRGYFDIDLLSSPVSEDTRITSQFRYSRLQDAR